MKKFMALLFLTSIIGAEAFAASAVCNGVYRGKRIHVYAQGSVTNTRNGNGFISIDGRRLALFDGEDLRINLLMRTIRARNSHGDMVDARLTNTRTLTGNISRLSIPAYGINYQNVPVRCEIR